MQRRLLALVVSSLVLAAPLVAGAAETGLKEAPAPAQTGVSSGSHPEVPYTAPVTSAPAAPATQAPAPPTHRVDTAPLYPTSPGTRRVDPFVHGYMPDATSAGWVIGRDPNWTPPGPPDGERGEGKKDGGRERERPFRAGMIFGVGAPNLMSIALTAKVTRYLGIGASFGIIPEMDVPFYGEATLSYQSYTAFARLHPFGGGFFLGSGLGYVTMHGTYQDSVDVAALTGVASLSTQTLKGEGSVRSFVVTPQLGYQAIFASGFLLGFDLGAQIPVSKSQVEFTTNVPGVVQTLVPTQYSNAQTKVRDTLQRVGQQVLPVVNLQLGWMF